MKMTVLTRSCVLIPLCLFFLDGERNIGIAEESEWSLTHLRCEYRSEPLGIDVIEPRLSWILESAKRGLRQAAYQIVVASSNELLARDQGDLWDTGKIVSDNTSAIVYAGMPLKTGQPCYWKVRAWDSEGNLSAWSESAKWTMGLLHPEDWQAEWIGYDAERKPQLSEAPLDGADWICSSVDAPGEVAAGNRLYIAQFELPKDAIVDDAEVLAIADDKLWMAINGKMLIHGETGWEKVKPVAVSEVLRPGKNELRFNVLNEHQGPSGLLVRMTIKLNNGETILITSEDSWHCAGSPGQHWPSEKIQKDQLESCQKIGPYGCEPWGHTLVERLFLPPTTLLRKEFVARKPIASAMLYVTALGNCEPRLNGELVSDEYFTPGWTDYAKRVYYRCYDVSHLIHSGENALGAVLADGWFSGYIGWGRNRNHYGDQPRLRMQLNLTYQDGTSNTIGTSGDWRASPGPTREADFLMGEVFDARLKQTGWDKPGFADENWQRVDVGSQVDPVVQSHPGPAVVAIAEFAPVSITEPRPGIHVCDLGQNFAGIVRLQVNGQPGQRIQLRFAEKLNPDGTLYTTNLRGARAMDTYICAGNGREVWQPRFTFHGFQYVEITGLTEPPDQETVTGIALSSNTPRTGWFECSDPMLNQLHSNIYWTQRANFIDVPTDCPQRDERLGWTGDAQVYVATACLNTDVHTFFTKWLTDLTDAQRQDGQFPMVAPLKVAGDDGGPAWADAGVICPWTVYEVYDDQRLLNQHYDSMKRFVEFSRQRSKGDCLPPDEFHCFGDWLSINADTPLSIVYTTYYAHSVRILAQAAEVLGHSEDASTYRQLFEKIRSAFNEAYVNEDGRIEGDTQCCYVLALANDLLDGEQRDQAVQHLIDDIASRDFHLSTGFLGTKDLMLVLAKVGRNDIAYRLIANESFPSWGFSIKHGATSIWERWDGWTPDKGFQDPGMNSFAHYSFGAVYQWMVENIGGIQRTNLGYKHFVIAPQPGGNLTWAKVDYDSLHGRIAAHWKKEQGRLVLKVKIPANTTAEIRLPAENLQSITEQGHPLAEVSGIESLRFSGGEATLNVASGNYSFVVESSQR